MNDDLNKYKDKIVNGKLYKAEGTGPVSKLFSWLAGHTLVFLIVILFIDKLYIPIIIFLLFGFTRLSIYLGFIGIAYFTYTQYWFGLILLSIYTIFAFLSVKIGRKHIKDNLFNGKTNISPFEGMNDMPIIIYSQLILFGFAIYCNGWISIMLWIIYTFLTLILISRVNMRLKSKWCSIYYPISIRYIYFMGFEAESSRKQGKTPSIENAIRVLLKSIYSHFTEIDIENFIETAKLKLYNFTDKKDLITFYMQFYKNPNEEVFTKIFARLQNDIIKGDDRLLPFYIYAEIIERDFGKQERLKYLMEKINGKLV
ncbi:MAG: hypothetical protein ACOYN6_10130 [Ignavibacteria bacterium]